MRLGAQLPIVLLSVVPLLGCGHTSRKTPGNEVEPRDVRALRTALAGVKNPEVLVGKFPILESMHAAYDETLFGSVGGDATSVMFFFFSESGRIYRIHEDNTLRKGKRLVEIPNTPKWLKENRGDVRKKAKQPARAKKE